MFRRILKQTLPTMIAFTMSGMYSVVDGLFVGKAAGDIGLAAINIAWPIPAVITALGVGIGTGGSVLYSNMMGKGDREGCRRMFNTTATLLVLAGILLSLFLFLVRDPLLQILGAEGEVLEEAQKYTGIIIAGGVLQVCGTGITPILRNMNLSFAAMISMVTGFAVNIGVNYYLMFPMGMGIRGAAWGTVTAQLVVLVISVAVLLKAYKEKARPALEGKLAAGICRSGVTAFGVSLAPTVALIFTNWQCLRYGGNAAVACYAVISYIVFPVQYLLTGIGDGVQPLLSYYNGAGKPAELAQVRKTARAGAGVLGVITMAAVFICTPHLARWFGLSDEAVVFFETGMRISALAFLVTGFVKFNLSYLNAVLKTKLAVILTFAESLIVSPAYLFLLPVAVGMSGIWISLPAAAVTMLVIYGIINRKEMSYEKKD
ncbi:MATE family efflux transporter [Mordavella massiliensis]|uniref:MATE family efflux transporter n=1 Tax=Mordavella massiliensis TaxID=1871024 RepID=UPI00210C30C2|nr:MATE family efflux transporter [Mordavella massiliensis]